MKAWLLDQLTGIGALRLGEFPDPQPAEDEVVLEMRYASLNPADRYLAERQYPANPPLPHILGRDGLGVVAAVGASVKDVKIGERRLILRGEVGVSRRGTFAQRVAVPADCLEAVPPKWSEAQAAGATLVYLTAWQALTMWGELPPSVVLISGASGGVGVAAVQLAVAMGHRVIALSRSEEKRRRLMAMGAAMALDPTDPQWRKRVKDELPARVELAIDNVGGALLPQMIDTLGELGKVSIVGRLAGPVPQFNTASLLFRRIRMGGVAIGAYRCDESHRYWRQVLALMSRTGAVPLVDSIFPFERLPEAFAKLADGPMGKVVLAVSG